MFWIKFCLGCPERRLLKEFMLIWNWSRMLSKVCFVLCFSECFFFEQKKKLEGNKVMLNKYIITKSLTKDPADYGDAHTQAHVVVALRMRAQGMAIRSGDFVE